MSPRPVFTGESHLELASRFRYVSILNCMSIITDAVKYGRLIRATVFLTVDNKDNWDKSLSVEN